MHGKSQEMLQQNQKYHNSQVCIELRILCLDMEPSILLFHYVPSEMFPLFKCFHNIKTIL